MNIQELLKSIGFNQKESEILSYLYGKGKCIASTISRELNIPKSTTLFILYKLEKEGIVKKEKKGKTFIFESDNPENLIKQIDKKIVSQKEKRDKLIPLIPKIRKLKDLKPDDKIFFYDKETSIHELQHSLNERIDNKDIKQIYSKNYKKIYSNEDFVFLVSDNLTIRFKDIQTLKKFILTLKDIDETRF